MNEAELDTIWEAALHTFVTQRCRRAYLHDLRNGLQGIYGGFDALTRSFKGEGATQIPAERAIEFMRHAIKSHELSLQSILEKLTLQTAKSTTTDIVAMVREVARFLDNDASARDITLRVTAGDGIQATVRPHRLRLLLMSLCLNAIDVLDANSELNIQVATHEQHACIDIVEVSAQDAPPSGDGIWGFDVAAASTRQELLLPVIGRLVKAEAGTIECHVEKNRRRFSLRLPLSIG